MLNGLATFATYRCTELSYFFDDVSNSFQLLSQFIFKWVNIETFFPISAIYSIPLQVLYKYPFCLFNINNYLS
jgi:hypothetical protein